MHPSSLHGPGEGGGHDGRLAVEDVLWRVLLEFGVPDERHAIRVVWGVIVVVVTVEEENALILTLIAKGGS